ncbi:hypothetical protein Aduo_019827 [Ancylostoma duodenale]
MRRNGGTQQFETRETAVVDLGGSTPEVHGSSSQRDGITRSSNIVTVSSGYDPYKSMDSSKTPVELSYDPYKNGSTRISTTETTFRTQETSKTGQTPHKESQKTPPPPPKTTSTQQTSFETSSTSQPPQPPQPVIVPLYRDTAGIHSGVRPSSSETTVSQSVVREVPIEKPKRISSGPYYDEVPREYADERTPVQSPRSTTVIGGSSVGTGVTHAQQTPHATSSTYSHQDKPSTLSNAGIRDANRLGNGAVPVSSRSEAKPVTPTSKQTTMSYPHDPSSQIGEGSTVRYVFDVTTRTHLAHDVGVHNGAPQTEAMCIGSTQRKSRETTIDDPYYPPVQQSRGPLSPSRHSWHEIRPDYLGHLPLVQDQYTRTQKETLIDFPSPAAEVPGAFQRQDPARRGRPSPSPRSRSVDRLDVVSSTVVAGSAGYDPYKQGVKELSYGRTNVDMRQHPEYSVGGRRHDQVPSEKYDQAVHGHKYDQVPPEVVTPGANGIMPTEVAQPAYASIHKTTGRTTVQTSEMTMKEREEMLRKTRTDVDRASYPGKGRPYYESGAGAGVVAQQGQAQNGTAERNEFMIPEKMRTNKSPIMVRVQMGKKGTSETGSSPVQYNPSDYGDDWGEETTIIRKVDNSQPRPQLIEERYRYRHYGGQKDEDPGKDQPISAAPPPYIPRPSPAPVPPQPTRSHAIHGGDSDVEYGAGETHPLKEGKGVLTTTKKTTTTTRPDFRMRNRTSYFGREYPRWKIKFCLSTCIPLAIALILLCLCIYALFRI